jgi:competence protein CoiA
MKFALLSGRRVEAQPKLRAICPACSGEVIAKCGQHIVWHWAHSSRSHCDHWWESETDWHREWKNRFPTEWQEVPMVDALSGELHIADVKTAANLVIEFQRSSIHPDEVRSREDFYGRMIWVIDGRKMMPIDLISETCEATPTLMGYLSFNGLDEALFSVAGIH